MDLKTYFGIHPEAAIAFSGGVDSAFLLWAAWQYGCDAHAYYVHSPLQPAFERADARDFARQLGVPLTEVEIDILAEPGVQENGPDRCYHCKRALLTCLQKTAREDGYPLLLEGTNASDEEDDRPGMRALRELDIRSPLRECGLTKQAIRQRCRQAGLPVWNKPAYACLATRIPTGMPLTHADLRRVEQAESALQGMGFCDFRVRLRGGAACIQLAETQFYSACTRRPAIVERLAPLFGDVYLDLAPRQ